MSTLTCETHPLAVLGNRCTLIIVPENDGPIVGGVAIRVISEECGINYYYCWVVFVVVVVLLLLLVVLLLLLL